MFSDGKEISWDNWVTAIRYKLGNNADWYPTAGHRLNCVLSRCEGRALKHISPRLRKASTNRYTDVKGLIAHLDGGSDDPNRRINARQEYDRLVMKTK